MILVQDPIFNEPGVESHRGTPSGDQSDVAANKIIREGAIKHAMIDHLKNPKPAFDSAIRLHFGHRRPAILRCIDRWVAEAISGEWNEGRTTGQAADEAHAGRLRELRAELVLLLDKARLGAEAA